MKLRWRTTPISGHRDWRNRIGSKNDQVGRSAPVLAQAWTGPVELYAAIEGCSSLADFVIESLEVEVQTSFDRYEGGKRNHDLAIDGKASGGRTLVCVEAKAGESLGAALHQQAGFAEKALGENERSKAVERLKDLVSEWAGASDPREEKVAGLQYQLFTAAAGTVAEARRRGAQQAVLFVHDFVTDGRRAKTREALASFSEVVFPGTEIPENEPWCVEVPLPTLVAREDGLRFFLAHAVSDFRPR